MNTPFLDEFMWVVSGKITWVPMYLLLIVLFYRKTDIRNTLIFVGCALVVVAAADMISAKLFKDLIMRYRPSHHALLTDQLHFYQFDDGEVYKGGMYGFVSSHAANFFGLCTFVSLALKKYYRHIFKVLIPVAVLVSFSRLYLGVHYLSDLLVGGMLGAVLAALVYFYLYLSLKEKLVK
jgi:undecaprenyl-diphosphatase